MSREIKFSCMWFDGKSWMDLRHTLTEMENGDHWESLADHPMLKKFVLKHRRQWTGILDKNGVEIYEGDILEIIAVGDDGVSYEMSGVIEFEEFEYTVTTDDDHWPCVSWRCVNKAKVIGNIHEDSTK